MADAERSSIEIKVLLKNLDPTKTSIKHKDRLRRLNKFRNYITAKPPPEFYDDDYPLMLLGSESPTAMEDEDLSHMTLYGLLRAAGCPSTDHKDSLKRSARPAMSLLRYLCLEFDEASSTPGVSNGTNNILGELNGFASALCALNIPQLRTLRLEIHIGKGDSESGSRGGSKDDACHLLALILARHTDTDYETPKPIDVKVFLPESRSRAEFETWLGETTTPDVRKAVKKNMELAEGGGKMSVGFGETARNLGGAGGIFDDDDDDDEDDDDGDDVLGVFGKKSKASPKKGESSNANAGGDLADGISGATSSGDKPTRWTETIMASEKERAAGAIFLEEEREKATAERKKADLEKQRAFGRDPLGIHNATHFDLQEIDNNRDHFIQQTLNEIENDIEIELSVANESGVETVNWLEAQRQALLTIIDAKKKSDKGEEGAESKESPSLPSILPTSPDFDPILFLTLVHRNTSYRELQDSTSRLSRKTDNQVERLQNLVRDNFALFIRCSEGIDVFAEQSGSRSRNSRSEYPSDNAQLDNRFGKLDSIAELCTEQARKSFKPLLDNTNEVRKVQSALAVLQRVAPLLQVPSLMRQHIENANFSSVVKAYRKVLVIDKNHCDVDLLQYVRAKAGEAAQDARQDLELILADETSSGNSLLDAIRDLGELLELLEEEEESKSGASVNKSVTTPRSSGHASNALKGGTFTIDRHVICVRDYPPALSCLFLQTTHFRSLVDKAIASTETTCERIFRGEGLDNTSNHSSIGGTSSSEVSSAGASSQRSRDKRWKFEVLEARVDATKSAVALAKNWLPRLLQIGLATQEAEKRRMARQHRRQKMSALSAPTSSSSTGESDSHAGKNMMSAHDVFKSIVNPALTRLVEHIAFCSLGCANQGSKVRISSTFGKGSSDRLRVILKSPLPPTQTGKSASDLAELAEAIQESNESMLTIRSLSEDGEGAKVAYHSPLEKCSQLTDDAVIMIEQRVCIYSFDACARKCSISASGSGVFDGDLLLQCVQKLSDDLTRSEECSKEIEKGCFMVSQKCCEGLAGYVKDRSDAARLRVVAECANALNTTIVDVVREVSYLTNGQSESLESNLSSVISVLERDMFDIFLENVQRNVYACGRLGLIENPSTDEQQNKGPDESVPFPPYLAASFLTIVRCRAQVERALRDLSRTEGTTYQFLALQTASDGVVENICLELKSKLNHVRPQADVFSIHLQFLISTLKKYLSDEVLSLASDTRRMLLSASTGGRGTGKGMGNGPEGLTAVENLERLGRVYVMCLGD